MRYLPAALLVLAAGVVRADTLAMPQPGDASAAAAGVPAKGQSMRTVERRFGAPSEKYPAVGGDSPRHPPITRWDYPGFSVFFEHSHVVTAVVPGQPPQIFNSDQLEQ
ncbi:MAG: hypothetical protein ISP90_14970 [Nevskia sp.]|nr:hypothetical protein [Nevskia sp.]